MEAIASCKQKNEKHQQHWFENNSNKTWFSTNNMMLKQKIAWFDRN